MDLTKFGWTQFFAENFSEYAAAGYQAGRVALEEKEAYRLLTATGEVWGEIAGKVRYRASGRADYPAVGDWVAFAPPAELGARAIIHQILPRKSKFSRKVPGSKTAEQIVAANIDIIFIVAGMDNDLNPRRLERYLILAWDSGASPVIVLNKVDLCENPATAIDELRKVTLDVPIITISAKQQLGLDQLREYLSAGQTASLIGSSGVGKSTIINSLAGQQLQRTQAVRDGDERGKHTTTHRELFILPEGGLLIDTPGMRELQLWLGERGLQDAFDDINTIQQECYFNDCRHQAEPDCAIKAALTSGRLDTERYDSYLKMQAELKQITIRQDQRAAMLEKERVKKIHHNMKKYKKR